MLARKSSFVLADRISTPCSELVARVRGGVDFGESVQAVYSGADHCSAFVPLPDALRPSMRPGPAGTAPAGLRSPHVTSLVSGHETHPGAAPGTAPAHTTTIT